MRLTADSGASMPPKGGSAACSAAASSLVNTDMVQIGGCLNIVGADSRAVEPIAECGRIGPGVANKFL